MTYTCTPVNTLIGKTTVGQHKNVQKGDTLESEQKCTLEASIKATKNSPLAESLRLFMEGLRETESVVLPDLRVSPPNTDAEIKRRDLLSSKPHLRDHPPRMDYKYGYMCYPMECALDALHWMQRYAPGQVWCSLLHCLLLQHSAQLAGKHQHQPVGRRLYAL